MRTGWLYTDMIVGGFSVFGILVASDFIAFTTKPQTLYYRVLCVFYKNRLIQ